MPSKNTRSFGRLQNGLLELKLLQLTEAKNIDEIVVSTNDDKCIEITKNFQQDKRLRIDLRPEHLCTSETDLRDLIIHSASVCSKDQILWTHVTSPFFDSLAYEAAIKKYEEILFLRHDSLLTGRSYNEFLLDPKLNELVNNRSNLPWPRTQDLQELFEINNAVFLGPRELFSEGKRVGQRPFYMYSGKIASLDIDDSDDFKIAEALYERISK